MASSMSISMCKLAPFVPISQGFQRAQVLKEKNAKLVEPSVFEVVSEPALYLNGRDDLISQVSTLQRPI